MKEKKLKKAQQELLAEVGGLFDGSRAALVDQTISACRDHAAMRDLAAYIRSAKARRTPGYSIAFNVAHDLFQFGKGDRFFVPRSRGYLAREKSNPSNPSNRAFASTGKEA